MRVKFSKDDQIASPRGGYMYLCAETRGSCMAGGMSELCRGDTTRILGEDSGWILRVRLQHFSAPSSSVEKN